MEYALRPEGSWRIRLRTSGPASAAAPVGPEERGRHRGVLPEPAMDPIEGPFGLVPSARLHHGELLRGGRDQAGGGHTQQAEPPASLRQGLEELPGGPID